MTSPTAARLDQLRARASAAGCAGLLVLNPVNVRYLTGYHSNAYSRPLTLLVPVDGEPTLLVPRLEAEQAHLLTPIADVRDYVEWDGEGSLAGGAPEAEWETLLAAVLRERGLLGARLAIEESFLNTGRARRLRALIGEESWFDGSGWIEAQRMIKSPGEIESHRSAARLAASGLDAARAAVRDGLSEREVYAAAAHAMLASAAHALPDVPVAVGGNAIVGPRTASLHLPATGTRPTPGDLVFIVLVAAVNGSWCELSRTYVYGAAPTAEQTRVFDAIARASAAARAQLRPGVAARDVDRAARASLAADGFESAQPMRTGHGLGVSGGSEAPQLGAGDSTPLAANMVVSIEPSVCLTNFGGVCWADNFAITDAAPDQLSDYEVSACA